MLCALSRYHAAAVTYGTWDAAKNQTQTAGGASYALSGSNLIATRSADTSSTHGTVGCTVGKSSGKGTFTCTIPATNANIFLGIATVVGGNALWTSPSNNFPTSFTQLTIGECVGLLPVLNAFWYTDATSSAGTIRVGTGGSITDTTILVAFNIATNTVYFYNYLSNTLIATFDTSTMTPGQTWFPFVNCFTTGFAFTGNFGQSAITLPAALSALSFDAFWA
jgi:hypothetical protein